MFKGGSQALNGANRLKRRYFRLGIVFLVTGILSFIIPSFVSIRDRDFIGIVFLILGVAGGRNSFTGFRDGDRPWQQTLMAVTALIAGLVFLFHPLSEIITISFFMATYYFVDGVMRLLEFMRVKAMEGSLWVLLAGVFEVLFAFISWYDFPGTGPRIKIMLIMYLFFSSGCAIMASKSGGNFNLFGRFRRLRP